MTQNLGGGHACSEGSRTEHRPPAVCRTAGRASSPGFTERPVNPPEGEGLDPRPTVRQVATMSLSGSVPACGYAINRKE